MFVIVWGLFLQGVDTCRWISTPSNCSPSTLPSGDCRSCSLCPLLNYPLCLLYHIKHSLPVLRNFRASNPISNSTSCVCFWCCIFVLSAKESWIVLEQRPFLLSPSTEEVRNIGEHLSSFNILITPMKRCCLSFHVLVTLLIPPNHLRSYSSIISTSFATIILMPRILLIGLWRSMSIFFKSASLPDQFSLPCKERFIGIALCNLILVIMLFLCIPHAF